MAKTRYARKVSKRKGVTKRKGSTKRKGATKRRANTKRRGMKNKRGGNLFRSMRRTARRLGNFGSKGVSNAASGVGSAARSAASGVGSAARSAKGKATDAAMFAASKARVARENVRAAAAESGCVGVDDELAEAQNKLLKVQERITRLEAKQDVCDPAYGLNALNV